jgi:hypothetical protein
VCRVARVVGALVWDGNACAVARRVVENCILAVGRWLDVGKIYCVVLSGMLMSEVVQGKEEEEEKGNERKELVL